MTAHLVQGHDGFVDAGVTAGEYRNDAPMVVRVRFADTREKFDSGVDASVDLDPRAARKLALRLLVVAEAAEEGRIA